MSLLRIRIQPPEAPDAARTADAAAKPGDSYVERLLKLIPAEAIGIYLVGLQVVGTDPKNGLAVGQWSLACIAFVFVFRSILSTESPKFGVGEGKGFFEWWQQIRKEIQWPAVLIATVSFIVWASALGYPIAPWFSAARDACAGEGTAQNVVCAGEKAGTLILLLWTPIAAFLYTGERVGNLAPEENGDDDNNNGGNAGPTNEPSPKKTAPTPPAGRRVISPDTRSQATQLDRSPYKSIALLHAFRSGQSTASQIGTGWLVKPGHVVTAGHVLKGASRIRGWLAYDADNDAWGAYFESTRLTPHPDYIDNADASFDIGVVHLDSNLPGASVLPLKNPTADAPQDLRCAGYPLDKGGLTMFEGSGGPHSVDRNLLFHTIDTDEGQSGAPIWFGVQRKVAGVHTGHGIDPQPDQNHAVFLNTEIVDWIKQTTA